MPIEPRDLPREIQDMLDTPAREGACIQEQPVCHPDPRVTAQLTDDPPLDSIVKPWRIVNAKKGDLLLSPGGPSGLIGGLLSRLDDPQFYSHMGIMVEGEIAIRHATASSDRATHQDFVTGTIFGEPAPTDGYKEVALRFQWPGTITQAVEQAYLTWRDHPKEEELDDEGNQRPKRYPSRREVPHQDFSFYDPVTDERYHIDSFSFKPKMVSLDEWQTATEVWPLVVKPCPDLETTEVRKALHRIAEASKEVRAHYRLFAYTRADIAGDPAFVGPQMLEDLQCDPSSGCTGARPVLIPVSETVPLVCSTFVWWAVQVANRTAPKIFLDVRPLNRRRRSELAAACLHDPLLGRKPHPNDERVHVAADGLYRYSEAERQRAGKWLHDEYVVPMVRGKIDEALPFVLRAAGAGGFFSLSTLLHALSAFPLAVVARMLAVGTLVLNELIAWMTDMPDDVANQLCNTFAADQSDSSATDSDNWRNPGTGLTVSPDDIINEWAPPQSETTQEIHGLYGHNVRMILRPPELDLNPPPLSTWQISPGFAEFQGRVFLHDRQGNPIGVRGAAVRIGCDTWITGDDGIYVAPQAPAGLYWGVASYTDPATGLHCEADGRRVHVGIPGGSESEFDFELHLPPDTRREVVIRGKMDLTNRHIIGKDWHSHPLFIEGPAILDVDFFLFPDEPKYEAQRKASRQQTLLVSLPVENWGHAEIEFQLTIQSDKSVLVTYQARLREEHDDPWQESGQLVVPPKQAHGDPGTVGPVVNMMRKPFSPVRAHIEFEVHNDWAR